MLPLAKAVGISKIKKYITTVLDKGEKNDIIIPIRAKGNKHKKRTCSGYANHKLPVGGALQGNGSKRK